MYACLYICMLSSVNVDILAAIQVVLLHCVGENAAKSCQSYTLYQTLIDIIKPKNNFATDSLHSSVWKRMGRDGVVGVYHTRESQRVYHSKESTWVCNSRESQGYTILGNHRVHTIKHIHSVYTTPDNHRMNTIPESHRGTPYHRCIGGIQYQRITGRIQYHRFTVCIPYQIIRTRINNPPQK